MSGVTVTFSVASGGGSITGASAYLCIRHRGSAADLGLGVNSLLLPRRSQ